MTRKIAIVGINGVPARYGGFETLAENLVRYHHAHRLADGLTVYCSAHSYDKKPDAYLSTRLEYVGLSANGLSSIAYDVVSMLRAVWSGHDTILILGVSGAIGLPLIRLASSARIITNVDGIEWKREKWSRLTRWVLRASEWLAVLCSHVVIADNQGIVDHVKAEYGASTVLIPYGGDHAIEAVPTAADTPDLPANYALSLCRIEPENNIHLILEAFATEARTPLVFVGNWDNSEYGRTLKARCGRVANLHLLDPVYDPGVLSAIRSAAATYVHGHSAGGTNPSLVEMMHFGIPVVAYDCLFNRYTTEERALYFRDAGHLQSAMATLDADTAHRIGDDMRRIAQARYTWNVVGEAYFRLLSSGDASGSKAGGVATQL